MFLLTNKSLFVVVHQGGGLMDKTLGLNAGRSGVQIPGRGKFSLRTKAVDASVKYQLYFIFSWLSNVVGFMFDFLLLLKNKKLPHFLE